MAETAVVRAGEPGALLGAGLGVPAVSVGGVPDGAVPAGAPASRKAVDLPLDPATRPGGQTAERQTPEYLRCPPKFAFRKATNGSRARGRGRREKAMRPRRRSLTPKRTWDLERQLGQPAVSKMPPSDGVGPRLAGPETPGWQRRPECHGRKCDLPCAECPPGCASRGTVPGAGGCFRVP